VKGKSVFFFIDSENKKFYYAIMKIIPNLKPFDGNGSRAGLLEDFLDSSSDDEGSFALEEGDIKETTKTVEKGQVNQSFRPAHLTVTRSDSQHSLTADERRSTGIVGNLRSSFMMAKQLSVKQLQKQYSKRSLFSAASSSHHELPDDPEEMANVHVGELLNREILVNEQKAIQSDTDDMDFVRDVASLRTNLGRQNSERMHLKTKNIHDESDTLTSRSHHPRMKKEMFSKAEKDSNFSRHTPIGDFSAVHIKASAGVIAGSGGVRARRGRGNSQRTVARKRLTRSKSDPSDIEKMVHGLMVEKDSAGKSGNVFNETALPRGSRTIRRHKSANAQDLLEMMRDNQTQYKCESSLTSDITSDLCAADGNSNEHSLLSPTCSFTANTSQTEEILSEISDTEGEKSTPSPSESESSHKVATEREHQKCLKRTDRTPFVKSIPSTRIEPVELPYCSSHKLKRTGKVGQDEEVFVFEIDKSRPFVRSKHRGMKEFLQLNISNRSLEG
jgi:hypothetical protein